MKQVRSLSQADFGCWEPGSGADRDPGVEELGEEDPQSSSGAQSNIALGFGSQDAQTPGPRRTAEHLCGCHGSSTRMASIRRGGTLCVRNVGIKNMRNFNRCGLEVKRFQPDKCCVEDCAQQGEQSPRWYSRVQNTD